jgi:methionyl aminopeptidase
VSSSDSKRRFSFNLLHFPIFKPHHFSLFLFSLSFNVVRTYCGHGIGDLFHCAPNIPHYAGNKAVGAMKAGQVFTIEPMVNAGSWRDTTWPDGWTAVTTDGARSAQFEHTLVVTEKGCEVLTARLPTSPPLCF